MFSIGFTFDPRKAHIHMVGQLTKAVAHSDTVLHQIVRTVTTQAVRSIVGDLSAKKLCSGQVACHLERALRRTISSKLMCYGIRIPAMDETVVLQDLHLPESVNSATQFTRVRAMMAEDSALKAAETERWLLQSKQLEQMASGGNMIYMAGDREQRLPTDALRPPADYGTITRSNRQPSVRENGDQLPLTTRERLCEVPHVAKRARNSHGT